MSLTAAATVLVVGAISMAVSGWWGNKHPYIPKCKHCYTEVKCGEEICGDCLDKMFAELNRVTGHSGPPLISTYIQRINPMKSPCCQNRMTSLGRWDNEDFWSCNRCEKSYCIKV